MQHKKKKGEIIILKENLIANLRSKMQPCSTQAHHETCQLTHFATTFEDNPNIATSNIQGVIK